MVQIRLSNESDQKTTISNAAPRDDSDRATGLSHENLPHCIVNRSVRDGERAVTHKEIDK